MFSVHSNSQQKTPQNPPGSCCIVKQKLLPSIIYHHLPFLGDRLKICDPEEPCPVSRLFPILFGSCLRARASLLTCSAQLQMHEIGTFAAPVNNECRG